MSLDFYQNEKLRTQHNATQKKMSQPQMYGGDEVNAVVVDPGSYYTRIGFAGEDAPKLVMPTAVDKRSNPNYDPEQLPSDDDPNPPKKYNYVFDDGIYMPHKDSNVVNPMEDGIVKDWETTLALWDYGLQDRLGVDMTDHPFLLTEQAWNTDENRAKAMEIAFEHYNVPAFYIVKTPVCALLTSNKGGSGLVVDVGDQVATVTPVVDGLVLFKPSRRSRIAGNYLNREVEKILKRDDVQVHPRYKIKSKKPVGPKAAADVELRKFDFTVDEGFDNLQKNRALHEFKESMCQVHETGWSSDNSQEYPERHFELPDGYNRTFGSERFEAAEALFKPKDHVVEGYKPDDDPEPDHGEPKDPLLVTDRSTTGFKYNGISSLIVDSVNACDVDIRANLVNNIVITGGTTLVQGFNDRINQELTNEFAGLKVRIYAPGNTVERKNAAWIGGSILGSLGTFHQLWISKKEYEEVGVQKLLDKRFR